MKMVAQHCNKVSLLLFQFAIIWSLSLATEDNVEGTDVWLVPTDLEVTTGSIATFNCTLKCEHQDTHSMQWLVGGHSFRMRRVLLSYRSIFENRFYQRTGIRVTIEEETTCGSGQPDEIMKQTLSFKALSVEAINRTAVQCVAIRKDPSLTDFLSYYGVLLVKDPVSPDVPKELSRQPSSVVSIPSTVTVTAAVCPTKTETEYLIVTKTIYIDDTAMLPTATQLPTLQTATQLLPSPTAKQLPPLPTATPLPPSTTAPSEVQTSCCCCCNCMQIDCKLESP